MYKTEEKITTVLFCIYKQQAREPFVVWILLGIGLLKINKLRKQKSKVWIKKFLSKLNQSKILLIKWSINRKNLYSFNYTKNDTIVSTCLKLYNYYHYIVTYTPGLNHLGIWKDKNYTHMVAIQSYDQIKNSFNDY